MEKNFGGKFMKKIFLAILILSLLFCSFPVIASTLFSDVPATHWAKTAIYDLVDRSIVAGVGNNKFGTNDSVTRAQFCKFIVQATGRTAIEWKGTFTDVPDGRWYSGWVESAVENGFMSGKGSGKFAPDGKITRQEMAVALANVISIVKKTTVQELGTGSLSFNDNSSISTWAVPGIKVVVTYKLMSGSNNYFKPLSNATRAEAAMIIYSTIQSGILNDTATPTLTASATVTATVTASPSPTVSPSPTASHSPTVTPTPTATGYDVLEGKLNDEFLDWTVYGSYILNFEEILVYESKINHDILYTTCMINYESEQQLINILSDKNHTLDYNKAMVQDILENIREEVEKTYPDKTILTSVCLLNYSVSYPTGYPENTISWDSESQRWKVVYYIVERIVNIYNDYYYQWN